MGYLVLARRVGEKVILRAQPGADAEDLLAVLLSEGISIEIAAIHVNQAKLAIEAPAPLRIYRSELLES